VTKPRQRQRLTRIRGRIRRRGWNTVYSLMNAGREEGAVVKATKKKKLHIDENIVPSYVLVNGNRYQWVDCKEDC